MKNTPLVKLKNYENIYIKLETVQPTGSHKDRESEKVLDDAISKGYREIGCTSTGNAAISLSAYALSAGLKCHIYIPNKISIEKLNLIKAFSPVLHKLDSNYSEAVKISNKIMKKNGIYNANAGSCEPRIEGNKSIGHELAELNPSVVLCPTNNGTHIIGVWQGLMEKGVKCKMIAAICKKTDIATSIAGFAKNEGKKLDECIIKSKGKIVNITDEEIKTAMKILAQNNIYCEPASAASLAAAKKLKLENDKEKIICTITGSGIKYPKLIKKIL